MDVQISKWGNSLGLRLPRALARQIGVAAGQRVSVVAQGAKLIIEPVSPAYTLENLLANMTPATMGAAFDWGDDHGREIVGD